MAIVPITADAKIFANASRWLERTDIFVFAPQAPARADAWKRFLEQARQPVPRRLVPCTVPPPDVTGRPQLQQRVLAHLLDAIGRTSATRP